MSATLTISDRGISALAGSVDGPRRDVLALTLLVAAVLLLILNGTLFFRELSVGSTDQFGDWLEIQGIALALNLALIQFGWRRYVDLQHERDLRAEGERQAALLTSTDPLSGLLNRKGFADAAEQLRTKAMADGDQLVILSVQMHRFKAINDRHGHEASERLLSLIARSIRDALPSAAVAGRVSNDEFAIALSSASARSRSAEELCRTLLLFISRPFDVDSKLLQVGAYAGIAEQNASECGVADLLRRADIALDHAKSSLSSRPIWFDKGMENALIARSEIEQGIRLGLAHEQFVPFFEPQVDLRTGAVIGFEVLARWQHPSRGKIGPDVFIPIAEETGLIGELSERIIQAALLQSASWDPQIKISVNISPTQLADSWLAEKLVRMLTETGFPAHRLMIEITESSLFTDLELARSIAGSLKNQGIRLALDDFGTGFSSLAHLRSLPFDMIKIDRNFVSTIHRDRQSAAIIRAVTTLASAIDIPVTVEGIEDAATHAALLAYGCDIGQGWYFGKPMSADEAGELLAGRAGTLVDLLPQQAAG